MQATDFIKQVAWRINIIYPTALAPLKMYEELQRDMGPYRTVRIALYMFTRFTSKHVFLACSNETHTNFTLLHMSGLAVG